MLNDVIDNIRAARVLIIGDLILDRYCVGESSRISPEAPVPVVAVTEELVAEESAGEQPATAVEEPLEVADDTPAEDIVEPVCLRGRPTVTERIGPRGRSKLNAL